MEAKREIGKRKMVGRVIKDKMDKTVVVEVEKFLKHPKYHKFIKRKLRYKAHDENNSSKTGDRVLIVETRPLSKDKRWLVKEVVRHEELFLVRNEVAHDSGEI